MFEFLRFDALQRFFRREDSTSRSARDRLQLVLIHDRANVCPDLLESLRHEMIELVRRYMVIDEVGMSVALEKRAGAVALAASIPVLNIRRTDLERPAQPAVVVDEPPVVEAAKPETDDEARLAARRARILKRKAMRRRRSSQEE